MPTIRVREEEPFEIAIRRFKRAIEKSGNLTEIRRREYHEKPTTKRKRQKAASVKRAAKKRSRENPTIGRKPPRTRDRKASLRDKGRGRR